MGSVQSCCTTRDSYKLQGERNIVERPRVRIDELQTYIHSTLYADAVFTINGREIQLSAPSTPITRQSTNLTNKSSSQQLQSENNNQQNNHRHESGRREQQAQPTVIINSGNRIGNPNQQEEEVKEQINQNGMSEESKYHSQMSLEKQNKWLCQSQENKRSEQERQAQDLLNVPGMLDQDKKLKPSPSLRLIRIANNNVSQSMNNRQKQKPRIHLAYLFASPLVFKYVSRNGQTLEESGPIDHKLDEISYKDEFKNILNEINGSDRQIKYLCSLGTSEKLIEIFRKKTIGLHFSGHGLMNPVSAVSGDFKKQFPEMTQSQYQEMLQNKGDVLVFEEESGGGSQWFCSESQLKKVLAKEITKTKFVVVASCHSERCGRIFQSANAEHVICINQKKALNDRAACDFAKKFYNLIFTSDKHTITDAFYEAKDKILSKPEYGQEEADKYQLLVKQGHKCSGDCIVYNMLDEGSPINLQPEPRIMILPPKITPWTSRNVETYTIIQKLLNQNVRILEVFGQSGVGKSGIVSKVTNYIADRNLYQGGIIFVNFAQIQSIRDALIQLASKIDLGQSIIRKPDYQFKQEKTQILLKIQQFTEKDSKVLFVFDNVDELIIKQKEAFIDLLNYFTENCDHLQIIFTTSNHIDLKNIAITNLKQLDTKKARDLFLDRIPSDEAWSKVLDPKDINELMNLTNQKKEALIAIMKPQFTFKFTESLKKIKACPMNCQFHSKKEDCVMQLFAKHPMFQILAQPLYICLAASQLHTLKLSEIFNNLLKSNDKVETGILAIDSTVETLAKHCDIGIDILMLIGQTANGLSLENLQDLFPDKNPEEIKKIMDIIDQTSLLTKEPIDHEGFNYKLQNFCSNYVTIKLKDDRKSKIKYNRMLASYYCNYLIDLKKSYELDQMTFSNLMKTLENIEQNIIYCAKYLIELKWGELEYNEFDGKSIANHFKSAKELLSLNRSISGASKFMMRKHSAFCQPIRHNPTDSKRSCKNLLKIIRLELLFIQLQIEVTLILFIYQ